MVEFYSPSGLISQPGPSATNRPLDLRVLLQDEAVRHARDIVRHHARQPLCLDLLEVALRATPQDR